MGNCCGRGATVLSEPAPQVTQRMAPAPVLSQPDTEESPISSPLPSGTRGRVASEPESADRSPVLSSKPPSRTRSRAASKPESTHYSRMSSQDLSSRSRKKSAPQPFRTSMSSSLQKTTTAETLSAPNRSSRSDSGPTSLGESDG